MTLNRLGRLLALLVVAVGFALPVPAADYAYLMARRGWLSHSLDGGPWDRLSRVGYQWRGVGENIAWGYDSAPSVVRGWMGSRGHRNNILSSRYRHTGVGVTGLYHCQVFAY